MVTPDFGRSLRLLAEAGMAPVPDRVGLAVPRARELLWQGLRHLVGPGAQWLPEYEPWRAGWAATEGWACWPWATAAGARRCSSGAWSRW